MGAGLLSALSGVRAGGLALLPVGEERREYVLGFPHDGEDQEKAKYYEREQQTQQTSKGTGHICKFLNG